MPTTADRDWFRSETWSSEIAAEFERRLGRARAFNRPQYLRIQATHLLESSSATNREVGRDLLRRVTAGYADDLQTKMATEQLGVSLANDGRFGEAERALRETIRLCGESPNGRSGTTGTPELALAELILASGDSSRLPEVADLLRAVEPEVRQQSFMRNVVFRFLLASARLAFLMHEPRARDLARNALEIAAETAPALPRHPTVGRVEAPDDDLEELKRIAADHQ